MLGDAAHSLTQVLEKAWSGGFAIQSNFFRTSAATVALAASEGYITTIINQDTYGSIWRITPEGCRVLFENRLYFSLLEGTTDESERHDIPAIPP